MEYNARKLFIHITQCILLKDSYCGHWGSTQNAELNAWAITLSPIHPLSLRTHARTHGRTHIHTRAHAQHVIDKEAKALQ